ncbi:MAG: MOP flippase family protein [Actinomycetota bacterium]
MSLKQKTVSGLIWSFIDSFANQGLLFLIGIVLARLLTPEEFGLIGMLTIFIAVSQTFIDSGFGQSLIRKKHCTEQDYSTVFYYNLISGLLFYALLFASASSIGDFFNKAQLKAILPVLGLNLIIGSIGLIQQTILIKNVNFKLQTKISLTSSIVSGIVGIGMALSGAGVWSLVFQSLTQNTLKTALLWIWNRWKPSAVFSMKSFKEMFGFGSKLMVSQLIDTIYRNIYYLIIGKYFSAQELGYYTRARQFSIMPMQVMTEVMQRVSYPVLSHIQDEQDRLKSAYRKLIKSSTLVSFVLMAGLAAIARPLVITLIGEKWSASIIYLQLLCFVAMLYPLQAINLNMLKVKGRSDLFLRLEIIKKVLVVPVIIVGVMYGIKVMIIGSIVNSIISYFLNSYWSGKLVKYPAKEQMMDIFPPFAISLVMGMSMYELGLLMSYKPFIVMFIQILFGGFILYFSTKFVKLDSYVEIKEIIKEKMSQKISGGIQDEEI